MRRVPILLWFFLLTGCGTGPAATPMAVGAVATPSPSPTTWPTPTSTGTPTATPIPSPTSTSTPTSTPVIPAMGGVITVENASKVQLMETWGKGRISRMEWLLNGALLAVRTEYGVYIYDPGSWTEQVGWPGAKALVVSKNGKTLGVGLGRGKAVVWNAESKTVMEINQGYDRQNAQKWSSKYQVSDELNGTLLLPDALALTDDGGVLAIVGRDARIGLWNTADGSLLGYMTSAASPPSADAAFSANAKRLVASDWMNMVVWDVGNQKALKLLDNAGMFSDSPFSPDASKLVTFMGSAILIWDSTSGALLSRWATNLDWIWEASFSDDGQYIIINHHTQIRRVSNGWQVPPDTLPQPEETPLPDISPLMATEFFGGVITGVALGKDGSPLAWGTTMAVEGSGPSWWWRIVPGQIATPDWSDCETIGVGFSFGTWAVSPDCALTAESSGKIFNLYRTADRSVLHNLAAHSQDISVVVFSPSGKYFASGTCPSYYNAENELILWRTDSTVGLWKISSGISCIGAIAFSVDDGILAVASEKLRLWRISDHLLLKALPMPSPALAFSPDGKILAVAKPFGTDASLILLGTKDWSTLAVIHGPWQTITALAFTPDGMGLLGGSFDGTVRLWGIPMEDH
jgi:WD40 repeat protein